MNLKEVLPNLIKKYAKDLDNPSASAIGNFAHAIIDAHYQAIKLECPEDEKDLIGKEEFKLLREIFGKAKTSNDLVTIKEGYCQAAREQESRHKKFMKLK